MDIATTLNEKFGSVIIRSENADDMTSFTIQADAVIPVIQFLKEKLNFNFLTDLCGIHYPDTELSFGVIYHLHNLTENIRIRIKAFIAGPNPVIPSATVLYPAANWMERETFDFYGIVFEGHPNLKRILNVDYLDYFPMRKEYPLEDPTRHDKDDRFFGR